MKRTGDISVSWSRIASLLMLLVVLARAPLPMGFMPVLDQESGTITVAMCSGNGATQTLHITKESPAPDQSSSRDCPFAVMAGHLTPLQPSLAPLEPRLWPAASMPPTGPPGPAVSTVHPPGAPPTGPPEHV